LYYFRSRAWATDKPGASSGPGYRRRAKAAKLDQTPKQPNSFKRKAGGGPRPGQVAPEGPPGGSGASLLSMSNGAAAAAAAEMGVPVSTVLNSLSPMNTSKKGGFWQMKHHKVDPLSSDEQRDVDHDDGVDGGADLARWGEDDVDVRELVERLQRHHDAMESEFAGQKVRVLCLLTLTCYSCYCCSRHFDDDSCSASSVCSHSLRYVVLVCCVLVAVALGVTKR
jgi:hypothetical protein